MRRTIATALAAGLLLVGLVGPASAANRAPAGPPTIASIAVANDDFNALVAALACADLVGAVDTVGTQLTVFAPTDQAFADALVGGDLDTLYAVLESPNACATIEGVLAGLGLDLTEVLLYHVAPGRLVEARVVRSAEIPTLAGQSIDVAATFGGDDAVGLLATNIQAANGVIHVVDTVLIP
jgi:uncharacterized surface protein with fasciclin (FAS1) repeats